MLKLSQQALTDWHSHACTGFMACSEVSRWAMCEMRNRKRKHNYRLTFSSRAPDTFYTGIKLRIYVFKFMWLRVFPAHCVGASVFHQNTASIQFLISPMCISRYEFFSRGTQWECCKHFSAIKPKTRADVEPDNSQSNAVLSINLWSFNQQTGWS